MPYIRPRLLDWNSRRRGERTRFSHQRRPTKARTKAAIRPTDVQRDAPSDATSRLLLYSLILCVLTSFMFSLLSSVTDALIFCTLHNQCLLRPRTVQVRIIDYQSHSVYIYVVFSFQTFSRRFCPLLQIPRMCELTWMKAILIPILILILISVV